jgi:predicted transcriptional regulator
VKRAAKRPRLQQVTAVIAPELRRNLDRIAQEEHRTLSQVVRIALHEFMERRKSAAA